MNAPARFKQADIARVMKAAQSAGVRDFQVTIDPHGNIVFSTLKDAPAKVNSMDRLLGR